MCVEEKIVNKAIIHVYINFLYSIVVSTFNQNFKKVLLINPLIEWFDVVVKFQNCLFHTPGVTLKGSFEMFGWEMS